MTFEKERSARIAANGENTALKAAGDRFLGESISAQYSYNFSWLGRPIIQYPQDIVAMQELMWKVQPDLVIETGIAHGGSLIFTASMLELVASCGGPADAELIGIDIDIRAHNKAAIEAHPLSRRIKMIQGSSVAPDIVAQVSAMAKGRQRIMVCLDSNHTHQHVLDELKAYAPLVTPGSYCVVFDTVIEKLPAEASGDRPWGPGDNAMTAVEAFLADNDQFEVDAEVDNKLLISVAPSGYLRRRG